MLTRKLQIGLLLIWVALPVNSLAQDVPSGKWWRLPRVAERLSLTDDEKGQLESLFVDNRRKLIDLKAGLERERFELENLLEGEELDEAAIMEQFKRFEGAQTKLAREHFRFLLEVRKIVGFERFQHLKTFYRLLRRERERRENRLRRDSDRPDGKSRGLR
ncbi:MAG: periplasmic heavy metal sensor [Proteobacteria bacterium]|nr:periplasmic heavy metal sensor [Pseudomonadota bacterium]